LHLYVYNTDGSLDDSFGKNGIVVTSLSKGSHSAFYEVIQDDGRIIAGGMDIRTTNFALVRYNMNGSLDKKLRT
jgi:hypothetical protein